MTAPTDEPKADSKESTTDDQQPPSAIAPNGNQPNQGEGGRFAKGNKAAIGRRTPRHLQTKLFRDIIACTPTESFTEVWATVIASATGNNPEPWAVKLFFDLTVGNRIAIEQADEITELRSVVERVQNERAAAN